VPNTIQVATSHGWAWLQDVRILSLIGGKTLTRLNLFSLSDPHDPPRLTDQFLLPCRNPAPCGFSHKLVSRPSFSPSLYLIFFRASMAPLLNASWRRAETVISSSDGVGAVGKTSGARLKCISIERSPKFRSYL
jgi:hypothetical protein